MLQQLSLQDLKVKVLNLNLKVIVLNLNFEAAQWGLKNSAIHNYSAMPHSEVN